MLFVEVQVVGGAAHYVKQAKSNDAQRQQNDGATSLHIKKCAHYNKKLLFNFKE